jgi:hypothetical protein
MGSVFSVSKLVRSKSGTWKSRKAIPPDVRAEYGAIYRQRWEVIFSRPSGTPMQQAKADHAKWLAEVEQRIAALRAAKGGKGRDLTQREADALTGEWYRAFVARHTDNPGSAAHWHGLVEILHELLELDPDDAYRRLDYEAHTTVFLTDRGITLLPSAWTLFHAAVARGKQPRHCNVGQGETGRRTGTRSSWPPWAPLGPLPIPRPAAALASER